MVSSSCDNCRHCEKKGLLVLPLRYGVVTNAEKTRSQSPALPSHLGDGVIDIKLEHSTYALRMMRQGYLYVLVDKKFDKDTFRYWKSFFVLPEGQLYQFNPQDPPASVPPMMCNRSGKKMHAFMVSFEDAEKTDNAWFLFTPSLMSEDKLHEYSQNPEALVKQNKVQYFSPKKWLEGSKSQPHTLKADALPDVIPEFKLVQWGVLGPGSELGKTLRTQLHPAIPGSFESVKFIPPKQCEGTLGGIYRDLRDSKGAAIALFDHIGITQELNDFRNDALFPIHAFQAKKDKRYVSNDWKLTVSAALDDALDVFVKQNTAKEAAKLEEAKASIAGPASTARYLASENLPKLEADYAEAKQDAEKKWEKKYLSELDKKELNDFRAALRKITKDSEAQVAARAKDHRHWVESARLVDAFDAFSKINIGSGFSFTAQHILCTDGMFGEKSNQDLLVKWWSSNEVDRNNLYQRANLFNSETLEKEASEAFRQTVEASVAAGGMAFVEGKLVTKTLKGVVDTVRKCDSAWDEWLRDKEILNLHTGGPDSAKFREFSKQTGARIAKKYVDLSDANRWMRGPFLTSRIAEYSMVISLKPNPFDKAIQARVGAMIYGKLGKLVEQMSYDELIDKMPAHIAVDPQKRKIAGKIHTEEVADYKRKIGKSGEILLNDEEASRAKRIAERREGMRQYLERLKTAETEIIDGKEVVKAPRPHTNNFRQIRMLQLVMAIETFGLLLKVAPGYPLDGKAKAEILASLLTLGATSIDIRYTLAKAIREISPYKGMKYVDEAADIFRGKLKFMSGVLSTGAGVISGFIDLYNASTELKKQNKDTMLVVIYFTRFTISFASAYVGFVAAFSYSGVAIDWALKHNPLMSTSNSRIAATLSRTAISFKNTANAVRLARTLWLMRAARFNMIGLALTGVELIYTFAIKDDALENWMQACVFRKIKEKTWFSGERPYLSEEQEMTGLEKALKEILGLE